jgi:hypothetical protein
VLKETTPTYIELEKERQIHRESVVAKALINSGVMVNMSSQWSVKRVPLEFDWPVDYLWHGYTNPWPGPIKCGVCDGTGLNDECHKLYRNFRRWAPRLTEEETVLATKGGIGESELVQIRRRNWKDVDSHLIRAYLTEIRARTEGIWGLCPKCKGKQSISNPNPAVQQLYVDVDLYEEWKPIEPPIGSGWQLWQIRDGKGCPASAVFKSEGELAKWCAGHFRTEYSGLLKWVVKEGSRAPQEQPEFKLQSENVTIFLQQPTSKA